MTAEVYTGVPERVVPDVVRRRLYGDATGRWLILDGPAGWTPPEQVDGLPLIGSLSAALVLAQGILYSRGHPRLAGLARLLDIGKSALGNALDRDKIPTVSDGGWARLVQYLHDPHSVVVPAVDMGRPWHRDAA